MEKTSIHAHAVRYTANAGRRFLLFRQILIQQPLDQLIFS